MPAPRHSSANAFGRIAVTVVLAGLAASFGASAHAQEERSILNQVAFDQKLDAQVPLDLRFRDETGREVALGDLCRERPVVLSLVYYECPMLCTQVLNGLVRALQKVELDPGDDFEIVTVSIDPTETSELAAQKKRGYVKQLGLEGADDAWHFLVGDEASIKTLADTVGFRYVYDANVQEYAHPAGLVVLTPQGRVSRYLFDLEFQGGKSGRDLRFALMESSEGRIGSLLQQVVLRCYHYDPKTGKYGAEVSAMIRILGALTIGALGTFMFVSLRRERRVARAEAAARV